MIILNKKQKPTCATLFRTYTANTEKEKARPADYGTVENKIGCVFAKGLPCGAQKWYNNGDNIKAR